MSLSLPVYNFSTIQFQFHQWHLWLSLVGQQMKAVLFQLSLWLVPEHKAADHNYGMKTGSSETTFQNPAAELSGGWSG